VNRRLALPIVLMLAPMFAACSAADDGDTAAADTAAVVADTTPIVAPAAPLAPPGGVIRSDGIGLARIGMRIGDLRRSLPPGVALGELEEYMVDIGAMPVVQGIDTLYAVLIPAGSSSSEDATIELLATSHPGFRTAQGVGPGSTLGEAALTYGQPTLSYHTEDESREYARFPALASTITLRVSYGSAGEGFGGIYPDSTGVFNETTRFNPDARIGMVMVRRF
jgi:hypothetical protein